MTKTMKIQITGDDASSINETAKVLRAYFANQGYAYSIRIPAVAQSPGMAQGYAIIGRKDADAPVQVEVDSLVVTPFQVIPADDVQTDGAAQFYVDRHQADGVCDAFNRDGRNGAELWRPESYPRKQESRWAVVRAQ